MSGSSSRWTIGIALVVIGVLLLLNTTEVVDLGNLVRWTPSLLILLGIILMIANRFRHVAGPSILIAGGVVVQLMVLGYNIISLVWPVLIIMIGLAILFARGRRSRKSREEPIVRGDDVDFSTIMGSTDRRVSMDDLRGQEIVTVMGESKLDMRDIDVAELPVELCVTCVMGQVSIRVPTEWNVAINNSTVMGDSKDERRGTPTPGDPDLTVSGTVVMGSLKIDD